MKRPPAGRLLALFVVMTFALAAISVRLVVLQVGQASQLQDRALDQRVRTTELPAQRGQILDRDGARLALSTPAADVYADPRLVLDPWSAASKLAPLLHVDTTSLANTMSSDGSFVYLARQVDRSIAERIGQMALPGIGLLDTSKRSYPAGTVASQPRRRARSRTAR